MSYVGRFAPSPTGPLHAGSLLTAVASFLHARQAGGEWLVRIEDIDPLREMPGAADDILRTLEAYDLHWDRSVLRQSTRLDAYAAACHRLVEQGLAFRCRCSRSQLRALAEGHDGPVGYPGTCRSLGLSDEDSAIRMRVDGPWPPFDDGLQGRFEPRPVPGFGDYVIWRRDGLPAYHLAVVIDDAYQGITTIVRGRDLLDCVPAQRHLQRALGVPEPAYLHLPILIGPTGQKLSKQTGARPVDAHEPSRASIETLRRLGAEPPRELYGARPAELWDWAIAHWRIEALRGIAEIPCED